MQSQLDHIVIAHPDLEQAMQEFADLTGCLPAYGGPHPGGGTHNALASLGSSVYIELISPDPSQDHSGMLSRRLAGYTESKLLAWAARSSNLETLAGEHHGFRGSQPFDMSRRQPGGEELHWRLLNLTNHQLKGFAPFYIDWLQCPHPAISNPVAGELTSLEISHHDSNLGGLITEIEGVGYKPGEPSFELRLDTAKGLVTLASNTLDGFWS